MKGTSAFQCSATALSTAKLRQPRIPSQWDYSTIRRNKILTFTAVELSTFSETAYGKINVVCPLSCDRLKQVKPPTETLPSHIRELASSCSLHPIQPLASAQGTQKEALLPIRDQDRIPSSWLQPGLHLAAVTMR